jgi:hypothetical protein
VIVKARMFARVLYTVVAAVGVVVGAIGVVVAPHTVPFVVVIGVFVGVLVWLSAHDTPTGTTPRAGAGLAVGGATAAGGFVLVGLVTLLGPAAGVVIVTLVLVAGPVAWWWWLQRRPGQCAEGTVAATQYEELSMVVPPPALEALATAQLCLAWQRSYFALLDLPPGPAHSEIVRFRECLLDELERRDRDGFTRWLQTGARAGSNPGCYLTADR